MPPYAQHYPCSLLAAAFLLAHTFLSGSALRAQQLDLSFHPPVFTVAATYGTPYVDHVQRQADGRYVVSGRFQAVDGHATAGIARLLADGHVDTTFTFRSTAFLPTLGWTALAVQPDGKVLMSVRATSAQVQTGVGLLRLLPSGRPDTSFHPALAGGAYGNEYNQIVIQPDGKLLLAGTITDSLGRNGVVRLLPSGRVDAAFSPPALPANLGYVDVALEASGRMVCCYTAFSTGGQQLPAVTRLLASGQVDPTFSFTLLTTTSIQISKVARCPDGSYALAGIFSLNKRLAHLTSTGAWDSSFPFAVDCITISVGGPPIMPRGALAVQADGRILVSGATYVASGFAPIVRTFSTGGTDTSFGPDFINLPYQSPYTQAIRNEATVYDMLVEPGGNMLVAGQFNQAGAVPHTGLARLLPAAPLATQGSAATAAPLEVWPVPAHAQLSVKLPAGPLPQQVALLDATGRAVLAQQPNTATFTLNTAALPAGLYVLRVQHADGSVASRRVVVE